MIFTLAGHVDHGKTAVVHALTGVNTDRLKDEQARGLTIDLGFAYTNLGGTRVGFVDVPGHHKFIHNMIAGVGHLQHALLVIAADDGVMPQTVEHVQIMQLLGINNGTVILNKTDLASNKLLDSRMKEIREFKENTFLEGCQIFKVSTKDGRGIDSLRNHLQRVSTHFKEIQERRLFRMAIDRAFSLKGVGTVVTGTVTQGSVRIGESLSLTSIREHVRVRNLYVQGEATEVATTGDRASINIAGASAGEATRGSWLLNTQNDQSASVAVVALETLDDFPRSIKHRSSIHVYHLTDHCEAALALLGSNSIKPGERTYADVECEKPMYFKAGDRIIIRDRDLSHTIGGGLVTAVDPYPKRIRRTQRSINDIELEESLVISDDFRGYLELTSKQRCINIDELRSFWNRDKEEVEQTVEELKLQRIGSDVLARDTYLSHKNVLIDELAAFHKSHPNKLGADSRELTLIGNINDVTKRFVLKQAASEKLITFSAGKYSLPSHQPDLRKYNERLYEQFLPLVDRPQPMSIGDIAKHCELPFQVTEKAIQGMVIAGKFVKVAEKRVFTSMGYNELVQLATELSAEHPFTVKNFRDHSKLGRNLVIELLEYFDKQGITKRDGDFRSTV